MFSLVQNIRSVLAPLETKGVDARLEKKRRDLVLGNGAYFRGSKGSVDVDFEDYSTISIKALILFLEDFLEARLGSELSDREDVQEHRFKPWLKTCRSNDVDSAQHESAAAKAYARTATTLRVSPSAESVEQKPDQEPGDVYSLIQDLRDLQHRGVQYLKIANNQTFFDGIFLAVMQAKSAYDM